MIDGFYNYHFFFLLNVLIFSFLFKQLSLYFFQLSFIELVKLLMTCPLNKQIILLWNSLFINKKNKEKKRELKFEKKRKEKKNITIKKQGSGYACFSKCFSYRNASKYIFFIF